MADFKFTTRRKEHARALLVTQYVSGLHGSGRSVRWGIPYLVAARGGYANGPVANVIAAKKQADAATTNPCQIALENFIFSAT
jgi:hypothetical protein